MNSIGKAKFKSFHIRLCRLLFSLIEPAVSSRKTFLAYALSMQRIWVNNTP